MKKLSFVLATLVVLNMFGQKNPNSNRNSNLNVDYLSFFEYEKRNTKRVAFVEKVQIVNMSEILGQTFIIEGKAYILIEGNILYKGHVNPNLQGRIDLEEKLLFKKFDDNCITVDGSTCFTVRSTTMLPERIRVSDGKTISVGKWKNPKFHEFLLKWKGK